MTSQVTSPLQEASAQLVLTKFAAYQALPFIRIDVEGNWQGDKAAAAAAEVAESTGLSSERVREVIQLFWINHVERQLYSAVAMRRIELSKAELADADLRVVIEEVAADTDTSTQWLWDRFPVGGHAGCI